MVMVFKPGLTEADMKVTIKKERKMEKESTRGKTAVFTKETGLITKLLDMENMFGLMEEPTLEIGWIIKCMVKEFTLGKMVENIKGNISLIKSMDLEHIPGKTEESTLESGKIVNAMEEEK